MSEEQWRYLGLEHINPKRIITT